MGEPYKRLRSNEGMRIPRSSRTSIRILKLRDNVLEDGRVIYPTHRIAQGTTEQSKIEAGKFTCVNSPFSVRDDMPDLADRIKKTMKGSYTQRTREYSWEYVLGTKHGDKSPGEPWMLAHAEYKNVLSHIPMEDLIEVCKEVERAILEGDYSPQEFTFLVHSKLDGYGLSKIVEGRYRTVQGADMMTFFLLKRWYGPTVDKLYSNPDWMNVKWNVRDLPKTMRRHSEGRLSAGWDVNGMDRNINYQDILDVVGVLDELSYHPIPEAISDFAVEYNACGPLVYPDGDIDARNGGNPSGTYLTTIINCVTHFKWMEHLKDTVFSPENNLQFQICGDDNLHSVKPGTLLRDGTRIEDFSAVKEAVQNELLDTFGTAVKYEPVLDYGEGTECWAPEGFCAPFLDYILCDLKGFPICLPKAPYRRCRKALSLSDTDVTDPSKTPEVLMGVKGAMAPWYARRALEPEEPSPNPMQILEKHIGDLKRVYPDNEVWLQDFTDVDALLRCVPFIPE